MINDRNQSKIGTKFRDRYGRVWTKVRMLEDAEWAETMMDLDFKIRSKQPISDRDLKRIGLDRLNKTVPWILPAEDSEKG